MGIIMNTNKKLIIALIPLLVLLIGLGGLLVYLPDSNTSKFHEKIKAAQKCLDVEDYQQAAVYYEDAIKEKDADSDAFIQLARIYHDYLGNFERAVEVLDDGLSRTGSEEIKKLLDIYRFDFNEKSVKDDVKTRIMVNMSLADIFSTYTYSHYNSGYTVQSEEMHSGYYAVRYHQQAALFEYQNSSVNDIINPSTGKPYDGARPTSIKIDRLDTFFSQFSSDITLNDLKESGASGVVLNKYNNDINSYTVTFHVKDCTCTVACDESGKITDVNAYNVIEPKQGNVVGNVSVKGVVTDVTTGKPVQGVDMKFRAGKNNENGSEANSCYSSDGYYSVELAPGDYTVELNAENYGQEFAALYVSDTGSAVEKDFSISPVLGSSEIRFVLEWGNTPRDLDAHLFGQTKSGMNFHLYFQNMHIFSGADEIATLDIDKQEGKGPETITLLDTNGEFTYSINRYSSDGSIKSSGAIVKIYLGSSPNPITITPPDNVDDINWDVCTVKDGEITNIDGRQS